MERNGWEGTSGRAIRRCKETRWTRRKVRYYVVSVGSRSYEERVVLHRAPLSSTQRTSPLCGWVCIPLDGLGLAWYVGMLVCGMTMMMMMMMCV